MVPNITAGMDITVIQDGNVELIHNLTGAVNITSSANSNRGCSNSYKNVPNSYFSFDASRSSGVYNNTTTYVRPAGVGTNFCIKYI